MTRHSAKSTVRRVPAGVTLAAIAAVGIFGVALPAQSAPKSSLPKSRLELADSARATGRTAADPAPGAATGDSVPITRRLPTAPAIAPRPEVSAALRADFVRVQALIGVGIYAPAFATTVTNNGLAWAASYLLVAGGSFVAAAEISREMAITDPMQRLATGAPIRGAVAGSMLAAAFDADSRGTAASVLFASVGGTAAALLAGRRMNDGEAAATLFGSDVLGLTAFAGSTAAGLTSAGASSRTRAAITVAGMVAGAPLGHAYAALVPYHVSSGDLTAMSAAAGVGMLAGLTAIVDGSRSDRQVAEALAIGGVAGLIVGDRLLVRRYDHTPAQGRLVVAGGLAGGLMGAGVALLTGGSQVRFNTASAALTTAGAVGGIMLTQRYLMPGADGALRLGTLKFNPVGAIAAATGMRGAYTVGSVSF